MQTQQDIEIAEGKNRSFLLRSVRDTLVAGSSDSDFRDYQRAVFDADGVHRYGQSVVNSARSRIEMIHTDEHHELAKSAVY